MKNKGFKIGLTTLVLTLTFGGLLYTTMAEGTEYYKHVDEVMSQPDQWYGKKLQLHGFVVPNSINRKPNSMDYWFQVQSNGQLVSATYTGVALVSAGRIRSGIDTTRVWFDAMTDEDISWYVATGEPVDRAGAYAIQGFASRFIPRIEGSYSNVVGLPVALVSSILKEG